MTAMSRNGIRWLIIILILFVSPIYVLKLLLGISYGFAFGFVSLLTGTIMISFYIGRRRRVVELDDVHHRLKASKEETSQAMATLADLEARIRSAQDLHDHIGNDLTAALFQIEVTKMLLTENDSLVLDKLELTRTTVNQSLINIRQTVSIMKDDDMLRKHQQDKRSPPHHR